MSWLIFWFLADWKASANPIPVENYTHYQFPNFCTFYLQNVKLSAFVKYVVVFKSVKLCTHLTKKEKKSLKASNIEDTGHWFVLFI